MNKKMPKGKVVVTSNEIIEWILDQIVINTKPKEELMDGTPIPSIEVKTSRNYIDNLVLDLNDARDGTIREQLDELRITEKITKGEKKIVNISIKFRY